MSTEPGNNAKNNFQKRFSNWWRMWFLEKNMESVKNHRDIKLATTEARKNYLVWEPNYHATKNFVKNY